MQTADDADRTLGVAEAKRRFSELIDRVAEGERFIVLRRGRPAVALVPVEESEDRPAGPRRGLLALVGALADWDDLEETMEEVVRSRRGARDRPPPDLG